MLLIFTIWIKSVVSFDPIIHPEFIISSVSMVDRAHSEKPDILRIFNISDTEQTYYRPRVISFLLQYQLYINYVNTI